MILCFLYREHNRVCDVLKEENPIWDDERLFQTARLILTGKKIYFCSEKELNATILSCSEIKTSCVYPILLLYESWCLPTKVFVTLKCVY